MKGSGERSSPRAQHSLWDAFLWLLWAHKGGQKSHCSSQITSNCTLSGNNSGNNQPPEKGTYWGIFDFVRNKQDNHKKEKERRQKKGVYLMILRKIEIWGLRMDRKETWCQGDRNFIVLFDSMYGALMQMWSWWRGMSSSSSPVKGRSCSMEWATGKRTAGASFPAKSMSWREHESLHFCCCACKYMRLHVRNIWLLYQFTSLVETTYRTANPDWQFGTGNNIPIYRFSVYSYKKNYPLRRSFCKTPVSLD